MDKPIAPNIAKDEPSFGEYVENWMTLYKVNTLKPTTLRGYHTMLTAHLLDTFGDMKLRDIKPSDIQKFLNANKQLAKSYLMAMLTFMSQIFKDAIEAELAVSDPTASRKIVVPSDKVTVRNALLLEDYKDILSNLPLLCADDRRMMALMMLTGMRRGEALGLRWEDIDIKAGLIHIKRNVTYAENQPHIGTRKTSKGEVTCPSTTCLLPIWSHFSRKVLSSVIPNQSPHVVPQTHGQNPSYNRPSRSNRPYLPTQLSHLCGKSGN